MNGWAVYALVVIAGPMALIARWLIADSLRSRRQARAAAVWREHTGWPEDDPDAIDQATEPETVTPQTAANMTGTTVGTTE